MPPEDAFGFRSDSQLEKKVVAVKASEDREVFFKNFLLLIDIETWFFF